MKLVNEDEVRARIAATNRAGEKLGPKRVRIFKKCVLCLLHNDDPSDPESQTFEQYLELRPGDDIVIVPGGDDLVEKEKTNHGRRVV